MCEHSLVIGKEYRLFADSCTCFECKHKWTMSGGILAIYVGDVLGGHNFHPTIPVYCPECNFKNDALIVPCEGNSPIDVTQEFLSLPVRSRE